MAAEIATRAGCRVRYVTGASIIPSVPCRTKYENDFRGLTKAAKRTQGLIGGHLRPTGQVIIDRRGAGAHVGQVLLPAGMISPSTERGDAVRILDGQS